MSTLLDILVIMSNRIKSLEARVTAIEKSVPLAEFSWVEVASETKQLNGTLDIAIDELRRKGNANS